MSNEIVQINDSAFTSPRSFDAAMKMAEQISKSTFIPKDFQNNTPNCLVALELSQRINASLLMVMQNLDVIYGRPSWRSQFVISAINTCGRFSPLRFKVFGEGDDKTCIAWTEDKRGEVLESPPVSIAMAKKEGWYSRNGSKWQTLPELMLRYRASSFFGRLYAPEVLMGMQTAEEAQDVGPDTVKDVTPKVSTAEELNKEFLSPEPTAVQAEPSAPPHDPETGEIEDDNLTPSERAQREITEALMEAKSSGEIDEIMRKHKANIQAIELTDPRGYGTIKMLVVEKRKELTNA